MIPLTAWQRDLLLLVEAFGDTLNGLGLRDELSAYYGRPVNHPTVYTNLQRLEEHGLVRVSTFEDGNGWEITKAGRDVLKRARRWERGLRQRKA